MQFLVSFILGISTWRRKSIYLSNRISFNVSIVCIRIERVFRYIQQHIFTYSIS